MKKFLMLLVMALFFLNYNYAAHFLTNGTNNVLDQNTIRWELSNPLTTEPVFMILQKDLTDIN